MILSEFYPRTYIYILEHSLFEKKAGLVLLS